MRIGLIVTVEEHQAQRMETNLYRVVDVMSVELLRLPRLPRAFPWHCPCCGNDYHCRARPQIAFAQGRQIRSSNLQSLSFSSSRETPFHEKS